MLFSYGEYGQQKNENEGLQKQTFLRALHEKTKYSNPSIFLFHLKLHPTDNKTGDLLLKIQCPPSNRITFGQHKSDNNNRMIRLTDVFCVLFNRLIQLTVIPLSGGHCS
jgi:hypothetical protein